MYLPARFGTVTPYLSAENAKAFAELLLAGLGGAELLSSLRAEGKIANAQIWLGTVGLVRSECSSAYPAMQRLFIGMLKMPI